MPLELLSILPYQLVVGLNCGPPIYLLDRCLPRIPSYSLAKVNQDMVDFVNSNGTFWYVVMLLGSKNVGITYQRLMNKIFSPHIGRNIKIYVDDILLKSVQVVNLISILEETFTTTKRHELKWILTSTPLGKGVESSYGTWSWREE